MRQSLRIEAGSYPCLSIPWPATAWKGTPICSSKVPAWVGLLTQLRNLAVRPFGLKVGAEPDAPPESRIGIFPLISQAQGRVVLGLDDRHLDFRLLVEVNDLGAGRQQVAVSTIVKTHNLLGRTYLAIIMPFHRIIAPAMLAQVLIK